MIVYCFTNLVNNKKYVGVTSQTLDGRWDRHIVCARNGSSYRFHQAIRKYGADAFESVVLEECSTSEEACALERTWIQLLGTKHYKLGYNMTDGGDGAPGREISEATREKHRQAQLGKRHSEATKQKMRESHMNHKVSDETRKKLSDLKKGENHHYYGKPSEDHPWFGRVHSEETRKKISESQKLRLAKRRMNKKQNKDTI